MNLNKDIPTLKQIDTLQYKNLTVPVRQVTDPNSPYHQEPIICESDLPEDLAKAFFGGWLVGAASPADHAAYLRDFAFFMALHGHDRYRMTITGGDWSDVVDKYVPRPSEALELHRQEVREAVQRFGMANPREFGPRLCGADFLTRDLTLDLLVDPVSPTVATDLPELETYLSNLLGVPVNIIVPNFLPKFARATALAEAKPV